MTRDLDIIILALPRWDGAYSSTAFSLAKEFSKNNRVFYIDNPFTVKDFVFGLGSPQIQSRIPALLFGKKACKKIDRLDGNLIAVTPKLTIPTNFLKEGNLYNRLSAINDYIIFQTIKKLIHDYSVEKFIFINSFNPFYLRHFPEFFKPTLHIYHTVDDISHSKYIKKHGLRLENETIRKADLTFTTSRELKRLKASLSSSIYYLPNAADASLFKSSLYGKFSVPEEIVGIEKPIIIYTGHIDYRIDYDLLKYLLNRHQDKIFLMVGPISIDKKLLEELNEFSNIIFTEKKDISELPAYLHYANCAIIPFVCNTLTKSIYPLKINEYLAAGKPVVSTAFSEDILDFKDVIEISTSYENFAERIDTTLATDSLAKIDARLHVAESNTWDARIASFWSVVEKYL